MTAKVLIVDDDRAIAQLTAIWLRAAGYEVMVAYDGRSALAAAAARRPDLVLLDIRMPDIDGFEVNRQLRADPGLGGIPVIFLSAHVQEAARKEALAVGASAFLAKPYETADVLAAVQRAIHTSQPKE